MIVPQTAVTTSGNPLVHYPRCIAVAWYRIPGPFKATLKARQIPTESLLYPRWDELNAAFFNTGLSRKLAKNILKVVDLAGLLDHRKKRMLGLGSRRQLR